MLIANIFEFVKFRVISQLLLIPVNFINLPLSFVNSKYHAYLRNIGRLRVTSTGTHWDPILPP